VQTYSSTLIFESRFSVCVKNTVFPLSTICSDYFTNVISSSWFVFMVWSSHRRFVKSCYGKCMDWQTFIFRVIYTRNTSNFI